ncbi:MULTISPECIES: hypothetical protein [Gordonia]|uniref:hypothetical protein n=1 Tax=Gordonia TaxID=2053 RepID=UPI0030C797AA
MVSTYGFVMIADVQDELAAKRIAARVAELMPTALPGWDPRVDLDFDVVATADGARLFLEWPGMVVGSSEATLFVGDVSGRAVICEDLDEFGVVFQVWSLDPAGSAAAYRSHVQDPELDISDELASRNIVGGDAAAAAAALFDRSPSGLIALEDDPEPIVSGLGRVATPFEPWLGALGLVWPELA